MSDQNPPEKREPKFKPSKSATDAVAQIMAGGNPPEVVRPAIGEGMAALELSDAEIEQLSFNASAEIPHGCLPAMYGPADSTGARKKIRGRWTYFWVPTSPQLLNETLRAWLLIDKPRTIWYVDPVNHGPNADGLPEGINPSRFSDGRIKDGDQALVYCDPRAFAQYMKATARISPEAAKQFLTIRSADENGSITQRVVESVGEPIQMRSDESNE